jgi:hypothetical protein
MCKHKLTLVHKPTGPVAKLTNTEVSAQVNVQISRGVLGCSKVVKEFFPSAGRGDGPGTGWVT